MVAVLRRIVAMAEAEPKAAQPKLKVLRRTSISPKYIKADVELQQTATQYFTATAELSDKLKQVDEASAKLKQKLLPKHSSSIVRLDPLEDWFGAVVRGVAVDRRAR